MKIIALIYFMIYAGLFVVLLSKIKERINEKAKDDEDLDKFKNY